MQVVKTTNEGYACYHQLVFPFCITKCFQVCSKSYGTRSVFSAPHLFCYLSTLTAFKAVTS